MSQSAGVSNRSFLAAGVTAAMLGAAVVTPVAAVPQQLPLKASPDFVLTDAVETQIKAIYDNLEPYAAYAVQVAEYVLGFIPVVNWISPIIDLAYFTIEPLVQTAVYVFADMVGLNVGQIPADIQAGLSAAATNLINYALSWIGGIVPLPPLPFAAVRTPSVHAAGRLAAAAAVVQAPVETAVAADVETAPAKTAAPRSRRANSAAASRAQRTAAPAAAAASTTQKSRRSR